MINNIYYNQQRFFIYTDDALTLLGDQVHATSKMTWHNRQALNSLTCIPNNTSKGGAFREVMTKIKKKLRAEVTANAGRDKQVWD